MARTVMPARTLFGGKKPEKIDPNTTDFDLVIVGKICS